MEFINSKNNMTDKNYFVKKFCESVNFILLTNFFYLV